MPCRSRAEISGFAVADFTLMFADAINTRAHHPQFDVMRATTYVAIEINSKWPAYIYPARHVVPRSSPVINYAYSATANIISPGV